MPVFGLNNGMVPIVAYNYGAKNKKRITRTVSLSIFYATAIMIIGVLIFQFMLQQLLPAAYILAKVGGLNMIWWSFPIAEVVALVLCIVFRRYVYKKQIEPFGKE